jgi:threonine/homoserine/homoserine lactone efflux protein
MKSSAIKLIVAITLLLVVLTIMAEFNFSFSLIFFLTLFGQVLLIYTVYKVLTDKYTTDKTFDDWYEDHPMSDKD